MTGRWVVACAVLAWGSAARADPQWNLALTLGGGARGVEQRAPDGVFALGLRGDVMFGAPTPRAARFGPWLSLRSDDVDDLALAGGVALQLPVTVDWPLILSAGGVATVVPDARYGALGRVAFGPRSYNVHASYVMAGSVFVEARYFPGDGGADVIAGVDIDLRLLTIPAVILFEYLRGAR